VEAGPLPHDDQATRATDGAVVEWDSALFGIDVHVRTLVTREHLYTEYRHGALHEGTEGELYVLSEDPLQRANRFADPDLEAVRAEMHDRLAEHDTRPGVRTEWGPLLAPV
jgi:hypothetical protein